MVGRMLYEFNFKMLQEEYIKGGMSMFSMKFMGDDLVLLSPKAEVSMEELVKLHNEWFNSVFEEIKTWSSSEVVSYKRVWVKCYGISFHLWSKECLSKVVGEVATVLEVDKATLSWDFLE